MTVFTGFFAATTLSIFVYSLMKRFRTQNLETVLATIEKEKFNDGGRPWQWNFLLLKPTATFKSRSYSIWYYQTLDSYGCLRESFTVMRMFYAPLHGFYVDGRVTRVQGGMIKFEILQDESASRRTLEKILKLIQAKHREVSKFYPDPSTN